LSGRSSRARFVGALAGAGVVLGGCSALLDLQDPRFEPDLAGVDGGDASLEDRETPVDVGDAGSSDVATRIDAGRCSDGVLHDFCDDFEGARTLQDAWSAVELGLTGTARLEAGTFQVTIDRDDAGRAPNLALLRYTQPWAWVGTRPKVTIAFRAKVDVCPTLISGAMALFILGRQPSLAPDTLEIQVVTEGGQCGIRLLEIYNSDAGVFYGQSGLVPVTIGTWNDYELVMDPRPEAQGGTAKMTMGGIAAPYTIKSTVSGDSFQLQLGLANGNVQSERVEAAFDDLRLDFRE
jgi:hypothetical protein